MTLTTAQRMHLRFVEAVKAALEAESKADRPEPAPPSMIAERTADEVYGAGLRLIDYRVLDEGRKTSALQLSDRQAIRLLINALIGYAGTVATDGAAKLVSEVDEIRALIEGEP